MQFLVFFKLNSSAGQKQRSISIAQSICAGCIIQLVHPCVCLNNFPNIYFIHLKQKLYFLLNRCARSVFQPAYGRRRLQLGLLYVKHFQSSSWICHQACICYSWAMINSALYRCELSSIHNSIKLNFVYVI